MTPEEEIKRAFVQSVIRNSRNDKLELGALARQDNITMSQISDYSLPFINGQAVVNGDGVITDFNIAHGLGGVPSNWFVTVATSDAKGEHYVTADATHITVKYTTAPPTGTDNLIFNWMAFAPDL
jgi:hypothetical protein